MVKPFKWPKKSLADLEPDIVSRLIGHAADVALVLDGKGIIRDISIDGAEIAAGGADAWVGRAWIDTVTVESRTKILELLRDAKGDKPRWRQVNHPTPQGRDLPIKYMAIELPEQGRVVAIGRNLGALAALQQQVVDTQRQLEAEFNELQQSQTRYRALFHSTLEAVLIVDMQTMKIVEANPSASQLGGKTQRRITGRAFLDLFDAATQNELQSLLAELRVTPHGRERSVRLAGRAGNWRLAASIVRQDTGAVFLIARLAPMTSATNGSRPGTASLETIVSAMPDAFVVTDAQGNIQTANATFLALAQLATEEQARGQPIGRWLGRGDADLGVILSNLRQHGSLRRFNSVMNGEFGAEENVEISAVSAVQSDPGVIGFVMRPSERRLMEPAQRTDVLPRSTEQMTALVGRVPLKDLVRETTDIIERMCIEAALELTQDNRASAAEILGLSRQGLYAKLRRYGIDAPADEGAHS